MDIVIVTNSPGEITGWVVPVVKEIVQSPEFKIQSDRIIVFIPYCQYASGRETEIVRAIPGINYVFGPKDHLKFLFFNKCMKGGFSKKGVLIHLGSDYFHSMVIAKRLGYPALVYTHDISRFYNPYFKRFLVVDQRSRQKLIKKGINGARIEVVGDLVVDAVQPTLSREEARKRWGIGLNETLLGIFPGSRPYQIKYMTPFFLKCCEMIRRDFPQIHFVLSRSEFVSESQIMEAIKEGDKNGVLEGTSGILRNGSIITEDGLEVRVVPEMPYEVMNACDLILTIPGTNTAQIAAAGCPMVVVVPLNKPEEIPLDGIAGYVQILPFFGKLLKRNLVLKFASNTPLTAIPNRRAKREIVPEIRGKVSAAIVKEKAALFIMNRNLRTDTSRILKETMGMPGASKKIVRLIFEVAKK